MVSSLDYNEPIDRKWVGLLETRHGYPRVYRVVINYRPPRADRRTDGLYA
jgi:hypothetical protein